MQFGKCKTYLFRNVSVVSCASSTAAPGVPGARGAFMFVFSRLLSRMSFNMTSHLCRLCSPNLSFKSSKACVSRSTSYPTFDKRRSANMFL
jgi:hypothetical protein